MAHVIKISLIISKPVYVGFTEEASRQGSEANILIREVLNDYAIKKGLLSNQIAADLILYRNLSDRAAEAAARIVASEGFSDDITLKAVRACENDDDWMRDYRLYIGGNEYQKGNPKKKNINANIGYRIKISVKADIAKTKAGTRKTRKVTGHIISNYSVLKPGT